MDEAEAIEIAKRVIAERETWADRAIYNAYPHEDGWVVGVLRRSPDTPDAEVWIEAGGHRGITFDGQGKVVGYSVGR